MIFIPSVPRSGAQGWRTYRAAAGSWDDVAATVPGKPSPPNASRSFCTRYMQMKSAGSETSAAMSPLFQTTTSAQCTSPCRRAFCQPTAAGKASNRPGYRSHMRQQHAIGEIEAATTDETHAGNLRSFAAPAGTNCQTRSRRPRRPPRQDLIPSPSSLTWK